MVVWETREEAVKIVLLGGGTELAWGNGSGNGKEEKPGNWRIVALKWVEREVWALFWRHCGLRRAGAQGRPLLCDLG